jgi:asparagine synthase (glutamine-hydrolysing)
MAQVSFHRGPDEEGMFVDQGIAIGMCRLSIIDPAGGHQPFCSPDGKIRVVCNGEIYNFRELRRDLEGEGFVFQTGSDCEVLVHLYEKYGTELVNELDGMFAFAIWDGRKQSLFLARDRTGIKPLYYYADDRVLAFASEIKSLLELPFVSRSIDSQSLQDLLTVGYTSAPRTMFDKVNMVEGGHILLCEDSKILQRQYWSYSKQNEDLILDREECVDAVRQAVEGSVKSQMVSDVPLGAFLSGGVDSSAIVAYMARNSSSPVRTYSIGFDTGAVGRYYNELPYAREVAEHYGTDHQEIVVRPDVARLLPKLIWHQDGPIFDAAIFTTFLVSEFARRDVKVILSGAGGDELFGGYRRYMSDYYSAFYDNIPASMRAGLARVAHRLPSDRHSKFRNLLRYARRFILAHDMPADEQYKSFVELLSGSTLSNLVYSKFLGESLVIENAFERATSDDPINRLMQVDFESQLPNDILLLTDKMTMAASIECRVPLLSDRLVSLSARIPGNYKIRRGNLKYVLKRAVSDVVPRSVITRSKRGFGAPMGAWIKNELRPMVDFLLSKEVLDRRGLLRADSVASLVDLHQSGREDYSNLLQVMMNLEVWCMIFLDGTSVEDIGTELSDRARLVGSM